MAKYNRHMKWIWVDKMDIEQIKYAKDRAYQFVEEQQKALDDGRITEEEWFKIHERFTAQHYLAADNPRAQSGHSGGEAIYRFTRGMLLEAIEKDGTFIDVGCANGYLMEKLSQWLQGTGINVEFYGLDISEGLLNIAKLRNPKWRDRFFHGNALHWKPEIKFDYVCTAEFGYVPTDREREYMDHLYNHYVASGGRLIIGPSTEVREEWEMLAKIRPWGHTPAGYVEKSHHTYPSLCKRLLWFDKEE
jgi:hypothetical protein